MDERGHPGGGPRQLVETIKEPEPFPEVSKLFSLKTAIRTHVRNASYGERNSWDRRSHQEASR